MLYSCHSRFEKKTDSQHFTLNGKPKQTNKHNYVKMKVYARVCE